MDDITITYSFSFQNRPEFHFALNFAADTMEYRLPVQTGPEWTSLGFQQCLNCPLPININNQHCPAALSLIPILKSFAGVTSHDELEVTVSATGRKTYAKTTAQRAIGSMMGLVLATSGCPNLAFLRPMARFHLPLADEDETIFRAVSMYLMAQYFRRKKGFVVDMELEGLGKLYEHLQVVNRALAERLRTAARTDSSINAVIILDMYAKTIPFVIMEELNEIEGLFSQYWIENK
ncbi:MAG: hypothetical protein KJ950_00105 [Proteobacteria bacterium]|nr:hypothetical protein [Pseudomonadota bacterium]MBU1688431.1 hypothetical protein [Pseudomonadota bacterium]